MVQDGTAGWLVPAQDEAALAEARAASLGDESQARRRGEASRAFVLERLSPQRIAAETADFYREVIRNTGKRQT